MGNASACRHTSGNQDSARYDVNSGTTACLRANGTSYDVFLSFRGEDTRHSFTDHLYKELVRAGIHTFRDNDKISRGQELKPEIQKAIQLSEASVIVLSENYATSRWCLDELLMILEQMKERNHFVIPVFYHVDPSDVRKQNKTFDIKAKRSSRWKHDNVVRWKAALTKVANLTGFVLAGPETKLIKDIVDAIYNKLDSKKVYLPPNLTGMNARYKEINFWLEQSDAEFLAICGMGGSGKSTLAKYIVYSNWQKFENICILECISSRCKEKHDLLKLQEELFKEMVGGKNRRIPSVCQGTLKIEEVLQTKKALIVLDDIVDSNQLETLLGTRKINNQSKIIITTRENNVGTWFKSTSRRYHEYKMKLLDEDESLELLCYHAFGSKIPKEGYEEVAKEVAQYCDGNPLALEVLGSSLFDHNSISSWRSALNLFGKDIHFNIFSVLKRSYDLLPYDTDKELFLHIACFFVGMDMNYVVQILEPDYSAISRIKTLTKRCLVYVASNKKLMMHRLLQDMGRRLVDQESRIVTSRSRVWRNRESYDTLRNSGILQTTKGLALDLNLLKEEEGFKEIEPVLYTDSVVGMDKLELLQINFAHLGLWKNDFTRNLRWLCLHGFPGTPLHRPLDMRNLVALDMSYSLQQILTLPKHILPSLKILNLKSSVFLSEIHNFYALPNLETLILWNCHKLVHVCESLGDLRNLALLNMTGCESLQRTFSLPHSLEGTFFKDCYLECTDDFPLSFSDQLSLQYLNLGNSLFTQLPSYNHLKNLRVLDLSLCSKLKSLMSLPSNLAELYVYYCESLEEVTFQSHRFTLQEFGYEGCVNLSEIEGFIKMVPVAKLNETDLGHMKWLKEYQNHQLCLAGDDELMKGRSCQIQMLYEFNIMSTSLPHINIPKIMPRYILEKTSTSLSFKVPECRRKRRLIGINVTFKYTVSGDDWIWFAKIKTTNHIELIYNPKVFGKPEPGKVAIWLSYWPIGNKLNAHDIVNVSIIVMNGLEIQECGARLVYTKDEVANKIFEKNNGLVETDGGDLLGFKLSTGAYYLCRRDFFWLMELGTLAPGWLSTLVNHTDAVEDTEVRGWRKTGRPQQSYQSFTELKAIRCIVYGPQSEDIYKIAEMSKSSVVDISRMHTSSVGTEISKSETTLSESSDTSTKALEIVELTSSSLKTKPLRTHVDATSIRDDFTKTGNVPPTSSTPSTSSTNYQYVSPREWVSGLFQDAVTYSKAQLGGFLLRQVDRAISSYSSRAGVSIGRETEIIVHLSFTVFKNDYFDLYLKQALYRAGLQCYTGVLAKEVHARASIIVLAEDYITSGVELDNLLESLEKRRSSNHFVLPVFYHIEASYIMECGKDLMLQSFRPEYLTKVDQWHAALMEVASLPGISFSRWSRNDDDMAGIREIVSIVKHALNQSS